MRLLIVALAFCLPVLLVAQDREKAQPRQPQAQPKRELPRKARQQPPAQKDQPAPKQRGDEPPPRNNDDRPRDGDRTNVDVDVRSIQKVNVKELKDQGREDREPRDRDRLPRPRPNHKWHWHPRFHRWVLLHVDIAPANWVLSVDYRLPDSVEVWSGNHESEGCRCPHCGRTIILQRG